MTSSPETARNVEKNSSERKGYILYYVEIWIYKKVLRELNMRNV